MFIRRTTYKMAAGLDSEEGQQEFERLLRSRVRPHEIEGLINTTHMPNDDGTWYVVAIWQDRQSAERETPRIRAAWQALSDMLDGPPVIESSGVTLHEAL